MAPGEAPRASLHDVVGPPTSPDLDARPQSEVQPTVTPRRARHGRPSLARRAALPIGVVGIAVACLMPWRAAMHRGVFDDTFWHRAAGVWMLDHHRVMTHDVFSYTVLGERWITPEWGYDVVLAQAVRTLGPVAFWLLSAGLAVLTVLAVAIRSRMVGAGWTWTGLLCVEAGAAVTLFLDDRPQMFSYFFLALLLLLLTLARRRRAWLVVVPVLFALWANLHGSFLLGLAILALEVAAALVRRGRGRVSVADPLPRLAVVETFVASALATLVNPFGPGVYSSAFGITFNQDVRRLIAEWQSPDFHDPATLAVMMLPVAITAAYLAFSTRDVPAVELALASFLFVSSLDAVRFIPYFAIAWCALAASCPPIEEERLRPNLIVWPLVAVLGVSFLHGPFYPAAQPAPGVPVRAVAYLDRHPGRIFSTYLWNDYLDWVGRPVFVDGRTELYTANGVLSQYLAIDDLTTNPDPLLRAHDVKYVLWPPGTALSLYLLRDPLWQVVWRSNTAVVFRSTGAQTAQPVRSS